MRPLHDDSSCLQAEKHRAIQHKNEHGRDPCQERIWVEQVEKNATVSGLPPSTWVNPPIGALLTLVVARETMKQVYVRNRKEWRDWLKQNHDKSTGIWLVFYKKHTDKPTLAYDEAVEEALCFGWIDSLIMQRVNEIDM